VVQDGPRMRFTLRLPEGSSYPVTLALPGAHNVLNALAAAAVGWQLGVAPDAIARALESFAGIGRRFNDLGIVTTHTGAKVRVIDDYGPGWLAEPAPGCGVPATPLQPHP